MKTITFKGSPLTLVGRSNKIGAKAPDFTVTAQDLKEVTLADFSGRIKLVSSFPSLDTPVCDMQVKEFNKRASALSSGVVVIGISKDLPFAQKRFCSENNITNETVLSDYKTSSFGVNYGLLIKELNLLARSVLIIDKNDILRYSQLVPELTTSPNFDDALKNLAEVIRTPDPEMREGLSSKCAPCEKGAPPMLKERVGKLLAQHRGWELVEDRKLTKEFRFRDFDGAKYFVDVISNIAGEQGHHPTMVLAWGKVKVVLTTHAAGGLTDNDFIMAGIIDEAADV
jgi:thiol peroxidase